jgi:hypothetical protein
MISDHRVAFYTQGSTHHAFAPDVQQVVGTGTSPLRAMIDLEKKLREIYDAGPADTTTESLRIANDVSSAHSRLTSYWFQYDRESYDECFNALPSSQDNDQVMWCEDIRACPHCTSPISPALSGGFQQTLSVRCTRCQHEFLNHPHGAIVHTWPNCSVSVLVNQNYKHPNGVWRTHPFIVYVTRPEIASQVYGFGTSLGMAARALHHKLAKEVFLSRDNLIGLRAWTDATATFMRWVERQSFGTVGMAQTQAEYTKRERRAAVTRLADRAQRERAAGSNTRSEAGVPAPQPAAIASRGEFDANFETLRAWGVENFDELVPGVSLTLRFTSGSMATQSVVVVRVDRQQGIVRYRITPPAALPVPPLRYETGVDIVASGSTGNMWGMNYTPGSRPASPPSPPAPPAPVEEPLVRKHVNGRVRRSIS